MASAQWEQRFFASTRGQVLTLVRRGASTVDELARALGLTDNAVRTHLSTLERDGLVRQSGVVRGGGGKPAYAYTLTDAAERLFHKPYDTVLGLLLDVLTERMTRGERETVLQEVGHRLARSLPPAGEGSAPHARLLMAVQALNELGGLAEQDGADAIRGSRCPLTDVVMVHPEACLLAATLVSDVTGLPFTARCESGTPPRCRFECVGQ